MEDLTREQLFEIIDDYCHKLNTIEVREINYLKDSFARLGANLEIERNANETLRAELNLANKTNEIIKKANQALYKEREEVVEQVKFLLAKVQDFREFLIEKHLIQK